MGELYVFSFFVFKGFSLRCLRWTSSFHQLVNQAGMYQCGKTHKEEVCSTVQSADAEWESQRIKWRNSISKEIHHSSINHSYRCRFVLDPVCDAGEYYKLPLKREREREKIKVIIKFPFISTSLKLFTLSSLGLCTYVYRSWARTFT